MSYLTSINRLVPSVCKSHGLLIRQEELSPQQTETAVALLGQHSENLRSHQFLKPHNNNNKISKYTMIHFTFSKQCIIGKSAVCAKIRCECIAIYNAQTR